MPARNRYPARHKQAVRNRDGELCIYCGQLGDEIDHLIPRRHGGPSAIWNLAIACETCNKRKGAKASGPAIDLVIRNLRLMLDETRLYVDYTLALGQLRTSYR